MTKRELLRLLDGDDFQLFCSIPPPTRADIVALEKRLGRRLPKPYRDFMQHWGGVVIEVKEKAWPRPATNYIGPAWTFSYGFAVLGVGREAPSWLKLEAAAKKLHRELPGTEGLLPFFHWISAEDRLCFDPNDHIVWWHPDEPSHWFPVKQTFDQTLRRAIRALKQGKRALRLGKPIDQVSIPQFDPPIRRPAV